tara:strand:- start:659 stop:1120 length:462 start_codon:yes stop_codon:yes gene_type:complete
MKRNKKIGRILILTSILISSIIYANNELDEAFERKSIFISSSNLTCNHFKVWLAVTRKQQMRGLMHVRNLPKNSGMLFVYPDNNTRAMWMKNTYISLDMIFIDENGYVSSIQKNTEPLSLRTIRSKKPVKYVLELSNGMSDQIKLRENDYVFW